MQSASRGAFCDVRPGGPAVPSRGAHERSRHFVAVNIALRARGPLGTLSAHPTGMMRSILTSTTLCLALVAGCTRAADEQEKANRAQAEANKEIAQAERKAAETRAEANRDIARAENKAAEAANEAQAEANEEIAEAQAAFLKIREDYRHDVTTKLVDIDRRIEVLAADAMKAKDKAKRDIEDRLAGIRLKRAQLGDELDALGQASAVTWDSAKGRADAKLKDLESAIDKAD